MRDGLVRHEEGLARPHLVVTVEFALVDGGGHRHDGVVAVSTALRVHALAGGLSSVHDECREAWAVVRVVRVQVVVVLHFQGCDRVEAGASIHVRLG